jgi:hypothetical protein
VDALIQETLAVTPESPEAAVTALRTVGKYLQNVFKNPGVRTRPLPFWHDGLVPFGVDSRNRREEGGRLQDASHISASHRFPLSRVVSALVQEKKFRSIDTSKPGYQSMLAPYPPATEILRRVSKHTSDTILIS